MIVRPSRSRFAIRKWASAWAAICGRWVTTRTWWSRERPQAPADRVGRPPADPGVDLVEDERRRVVGGGEDLLDRERDAGQLAARGDLREGARRLARVGREPEDDLVGAGGVEGDRVAVELDRRLVGPAAAGRRRPRTRRPGSRGCAAPRRGAAEPLGRARRARDSVRGGERDHGEQPRVVGLAPGALAGQALRRSISAAARSPCAMTAASSSP